MSEKHMNYYFWFYYDNYSYLCDYKYHYKNYINL